MSSSDQGILFEFIQNGAYMKVAAIDPASKREVSVVTPASLTEAQMKSLALKKLHYVLGKNPTATL